MNKALQLLKSVYGYNSFRPHQKKIIAHVVSGQDALVLMPTGGGKSICYQIPAFLLEDVALVVSPLISLMKDQVDTLQANDVAADTLNSSREEHINRIIRERCQNGELRILYISPERLITEIPWLQQCVKVSMIAIDEAHCVSQWGYDFRPEYTQLGVLNECFPGVPILALTATADKITKADIVEQLHLRNPRIFVSSFDRPNLSLDVRKAYRKRNKLRTFGVGRDVSANDWHAYLLQMLQMGYIEIAYGEDKHLKVIPLVEDILYGRKQAQLSVIAHEDLRVTKRKRNNIISESSMNAVPDEELLFEKLRSLRKTIADEIKKPAYIVLSDKSLRSIASKKPTNLSLFGNAYGIGEHKKMLFGKRFVDLICSHLVVSPSPEPIASPVQYQTADEKTRIESSATPSCLI